MKLVKYDTKNAKAIAQVELAASPNKCTSCPKVLPRCSKIYRKVINCCSPTK